MNNRNLLKLESDSISEFQKQLYNSQNDRDKIGFRFGLDIDRMSQTSHCKSKMEQIPSKDGEIIYTASNKFDFLMKVEAHIQLPKIEVKPEYADTVQICYRHNLGHNITYFGECKIDKEHFGYMDTQFLDINLQYFAKRRKFLRQKIGSIPVLEDWNTELPAHPLTIPQPYSFSRHDRLALPILKSSSNNITFEYKVRLHLKDLIRMKVTDKSKQKWREIKCNLQYLKLKNETLPIPEFWATYGEISDEARNWLKQVDPETGLLNKINTYVEDIDITSSDNPKSLGTKERITLGCNYPAKHIFWMASLVDDKSISCTASNYTTNKENVYKGWNPCAKSSIQYGNSDRIEELPHEHFDAAEPNDFFPKCPFEPGFNVKTFSFTPGFYQKADNAIILKNCGATLNITLGDTNPFLSTEEIKEYVDETNGELIPIEAVESEQNEEKKDKYIVHVRTVYMRKLEIYWDNKEIKLKYEFKN